MAEATQQVMEEPANARSRCAVVRGATGKKVVTRVERGGTKMGETPGLRLQS